MTGEGVTGEGVMGEGVRGEGVRGEAGRFRLLPVRLLAVVARLPVPGRPAGSPGAHVGIALVRGRGSSDAWPERGGCSGKTLTLQLSLSPCLPSSALPSLSGSTCVASWSPWCPQHGS